MTRTSNTLRFGITIRDVPYDDCLPIYQMAENLGFDVAPFADRPPEPNIEGWTMATAVGVQTRRLILTHSTLNVPLRNPGLTAKMAASLDIITGGGRVQLTLGAGGQATHSTGYGMRFGTPGERVDGLRDAIAIMRGLWANDRFTYEGKVYRVQDATIGLRPAAGVLPIAIGAGGPRMMRLAGGIADGWIKNGGWPKSIAELRDLVGRLERGAGDAGRDPSSIRRILNGRAAVGDDGVAALRAEGVAEDPACRQPFGSVDEILDTIEQFRDEGVDTFFLRFPNALLAEQVQRFGEEVISKVRR